MSEFLARLKAKWRSLALAAVAAIVLVNVVSCIARGNGPHYTLSTLIPPSPFHGVSGLAVGAGSDIYAVSVNGRSIFKVRTSDGRVSSSGIRLSNGANDIAIASDGGMAWTQSAQGSVFYRDAAGKTRRVLKDAPGVQSIAFAPDGALYVSQTGQVDALWQIDLTGAAPLRRVTENLGGLRGFIFGADGFIYGALSGPKAVAKIDPKTGVIAQSITGYIDPVAVALAPDNILYAADGGEGTIDSVDFAKGLSARAARLLQGAEDFAIDPSGIGYAAIAPDDTIVRIDLKAHSVRDLTRGRLGAPSDLTVLKSPEGDTIGLADAFALRSIEMNSGEIKDWMRSRANALEGPSGIGAGRRWVLLANPGAGTVTVIDRMTHKSVADLRGYSMPVDALETEDGRFAILDSSVGELSLASAPDGAERRTLTKGLKQPTAMVLDGQGGIYVTETGLGRIVRVDQKTGDVTSVVEDLSAPEGIDTAPDGRIVVAETGAKRVVAIEVSSGKRQVLADKLDLGAPAHDSAALLISGVAVSEDGAVFVTSAANNGLYKLTPPH